MSLPVISSSVTSRRQASRSPAPIPGSCSGLAAAVSAMIRSRNSSVRRENAASSSASSACSRAQAPPDWPPSHRRLPARRQTRLDLLRRIVFVGKRALRRRRRLQARPQTYASAAASRALPRRRPVGFLPSLQGHPPCAIVFAPSWPYAKAAIPLAVRPALSPLACLFPALPSPCAWRHAKAAPAQIPLRAARPCLPVRNQ